LRVLFSCESALSARVRSFDLTKEARQMAKFARCLFAKTVQTALMDLSPYNKNFDLDKNFITA
jgi:hypothetical protein